MQTSAGPSVKWDQVLPKQIQRWEGTWDSCTRDHVPDHHTSRRLGTVAKPCSTVPGNPSFPLNKQEKQEIHPQPAPTPTQLTSLAFQPKRGGSHFWLAALSPHPRLLSSGESRSVPGPWWNTILSFCIILRKVRCTDVQTRVSLELLLLTACSHHLTA